MSLELESTPLVNNATCSIAKGVRSVEPTTENNLAENLTWEDDFFDNEEGVIAVFDFDYTLMESFYIKAGWAFLAFPPLFLTSLLACVPCFLHKQIQWDVYSKHVCITRDGIRFVRDKRHTLCGCTCTDAGRSSKTVPFDKITDCDIEEPGGNTCLCVENVLTTVNVDTASSGGTGEDGVVIHELTITGLKDPHRFRKLVWALKRSNGNTYAATAESAIVTMGAPVLDGMGQGDGGGQEVASLLREIRDELREQSSILRGGGTKDISDEGNSKLLV